MASSPQALPEGHGPHLLVSVKAAFRPGPQGRAPPPSPPLSFPPEGASSPERALLPELLSALPGSWEHLRPAHHPRGLLGPAGAAPSPPSTHHLPTHTPDTCCPAFWGARGAPGTRAGHQDVEEEGPVDDPLSWAGLFPSPPRRKSKFERGCGCCRWWTISAFLFYSQKSWGLK